MQQSAWTVRSVSELQFNNGQVGGMPEVINQALPNIADPVSTGWHIIQWNSGSWVNPASTIIDLTVSDPTICGRQDDGSFLDIINNPGDYTYPLSDRGGSLRDINLVAGHLLFGDTTGGQIASDLRVVGLDLNGATLDSLALAIAAAADTGLVIEPTFACGVATVLRQGGPAIELTGHAWLAAPPTALLGILPDHALVDLTTLTSASTLLFTPRAAGTVTISNAAPSSTVVVGDGSYLLYTGTANATLIGGAVINTAKAGTDNDTISLGGGANYIDLPIGNSLIVTQGADDIEAGSGHDTINVLGTNAGRELRRDSRQPAHLRHPQRQPQIERQNAAEAFAGTTRTHGNATLTLKNGASACLIDIGKSRRG